MRLWIRESSSKDRPERGSEDTQYVRMTFRGTGRKISFAQASGCLFMKRREEIGTR